MSEELAGGREEGQRAVKIRLPFQFPQAPPPLALERTGRTEGGKEGSGAVAIISRISFGRLSLSEATRRGGRLRSRNHIREREGQIF